MKIRKYFDDKADKYLKTLARLRKEGREVRYDISIRAPREFMMMPRKEMVFVGTMHEAATPTEFAALKVAMHLRKHALDFDRALQMEADVRAGKYRAGETPGKKDVFAEKTYSDIFELPEKKTLIYTSGNN